MENTVQKIPFLRPTIALAFGVFIGSIFKIPQLLLVSFSILTYLFLILLNRYYKFQLVSLFGIIAQILFVLIGILIFEIHNKKPLFLEKDIFVATVLEKPQEKQNSYKSVIKISTVKQNKKVFQTNEKILIYFEKQKNAHDLNPGDQIIFSSSPQFIKNYGNPFEFDYKKYLSNKKIYRQLYLSTKDWERTNIPSDFSLQIYAEKIREKLLSIYREQQFGNNELEILSALTLGYKRDLDPETKRVFSAAGAMHVLAVSGLHVGIVFWLITLLFGFLRRQKYGRFLFVILSILSLWSYAFITGLSPSVMRASTMFTIFVIGDNINRKANTYNSLAASALFLLLINPNNLFEVGFQLSYSAVFGIVFLQPRISKLIPVKNKFLKFFWILLTVSIAAQIATFPLTAYYFSQFPTYFWITNLIIIPAVMLLIPLGIALLIFSKITLISTILSFSLNLIIKSCYIVLTFIEQLPFSIQEISIHAIELLFLIGILLSFFLLLQNFNALHLKATMSFLLLFLVSSVSTTFIHIKSREIIVYNSPENLTLQLICGKKNYVISEHKIEADENAFNLINRTNQKLNLHPPIYLSKADSLTDNHLFFKNGFLQFEGKKILFQKDLSNLPQTIACDIVIDPTLYDKLNNFNLENTTIVMNGKYIRSNKEPDNQIHQTLKQGAFIEEW